MKRRRGDEPDKGASPAAHGAEPPVKQARRERTVVDYVAFVRDDAHHLRTLWAATLERYGPTLQQQTQRAVRVEVEKALTTFLTRLVRRLTSPDASDEEEDGATLDPAHATRAAHARRSRELTDEEARLTARAADLERELAELTRTNARHRSDLRALAGPSSPSRLSDEFLDPSSSVVHPRPRYADRRQEEQEDAAEATGGDTSLAKLRQETDAAFVRFVEDVTKLSDEAANTERQRKLERLLITWRQRESTGSTGTKDAQETTRAKLVGAFKS